MAEIGCSDVYLGDLMPLDRKFLLRSILALLVLYLCAAWFLPRILIKTLELRYQVDIRGRITVHFLKLGAFELKNGSIDWGKRLSARGERLEIRSSPFLPFQKKQKLFVKGFRWALWLGEEYAESQDGKRRMQMDEFSATVVLPRQGRPELRDVSVYSPELQLQLRQKVNER